MRIVRQESCNWLFFSRTDEHTNKMPWLKYQQHLINEKLITEKEMAIVEKIFSHETIGSYTALHPSQYKEYFDDLARRARRLIVCDDVQYGGCL